MCIWLRNTKSCGMRVWLRRNCYYFTGHIFMVSSDMRSIIILVSNIIFFTLIRFISLTVKIPMPSAITSFVPNSNHAFIFFYTRIKSQRAITAGKSWSSLLQTHECSLWEWSEVELIMMMSSNGNIFRVIDPLCGNRDCKCGWLFRTTSEFGRSPHLVAVTWKYKKLI